MQWYICKNVSELWRLSLIVVICVSFRAETILSGVIIRPDPEDPTNSTKMSIMLQNDVKGWIPHFVVNAFAAKAPIEWHDGLANYYAKFYSKKDKTEEGDSDQKGQTTTEEGVGDGEGKDTETQGQSTSVTEGVEAEGQGANAEAEGGGESQVVNEGDKSAETEEQPTTTVEVSADVSVDAEGGEGNEGEAPGKSETNEESSKTEVTADQ